MFLLKGPHVTRATFQLKGTFSGVAADHFCSLDHCNDEHTRRQSLGVIVTVSPHFVAYTGTCMSLLKQLRHMKVPKPE